MAGSAGAKGHIARRIDKLAREEVGEGYELHFREAKCFLHLLGNGLGNGTELRFVDAAPQNRRDLDFDLHIVGADDQLVDRAVMGKGPFSDPAPGNAARNGLGDSSHRAVDVAQGCFASRNEQIR